jgi:threonine/homoserine/homoserine lactone efflux protein
MIEFIPSLATLAAFSLAAIALTLTPGPDMTLFLGQTVANGRRAGLHVDGSAQLEALSSTRWRRPSACRRSSPPRHKPLRCSNGSVQPIWRIWPMRCCATARDSPATDQPKSNSLRKAYMKGLTINLLNPKIILFFVTFLPQFVSPTDPHASGKLMFLGLFFLVIAIPMVIPMILGAERISGFLKRSKRATRVFDWVFAGVMGGFALKLLATQAR